jgi:hypothetical protein
MKHSLCQLPLLGTALSQFARNPLCGMEIGDSVT